MMKQDILTLAPLTTVKAQDDELQAKYEYLFRTKILDFYKGEPIE